MFRKVFSFRVSEDPFVLKLSLSAFVATCNSNIDGMNDRIDNIALWDLDEDFSYNHPHKNVQKKKL